MFILEVIRSFSSPYQVVVIVCW